MNGTLTAAARPARAVPIIPWVLLLAGLGLGAGWPLYQRGLDAALHAPAEAGAALSPALDAVAELQRHLQSKPGDARAHVLLARELMQRDRFDEAAQHYKRAIAASAKVARDAGVWVELAEAEGLGQGGTLAGRPVERVNQALALDATHPRALDLAGSAAWEARDYALAVTHWKRLLATLPEGDGRQVELQAAIDAAARRARFALPSPEDVQRSAAATPEKR